MAHIRQSRSDSGLGFQVKVLVTFQFVPVSLGSSSGIARARPCGFAGWGAGKKEGRLHASLPKRKEGNVESGTDQLGGVGASASVNLIRHNQDSQGKILALASR